MTVHIPDDKLLARFKFKEIHNITYLIPEELTIKITNIIGDSITE